MDLGGHVSRFYWKGEFTANDGIVRGVRGGIRLPVNDVVVPTYASKRYWPRVLPLYSAPRGLIINAIIYAGCMWLLLCGGRTVRVARRRLKCECVRCGYPLRGIVSERCPECGWDRSSGAKTMATVNEGNDGD